ncbi:MAG: hypothetical protein ACOCRN_01265, partial [Spirochaetia bacterium]
MSEHLKSATSPPADISRRLLDGSSIRFGISAEHIASLDTETSEFTVIGQPRAMRALNMAVRIPARGYNVFATGPQGTGKRTAIRAVLEAYNPGVEHLCDIAVVYGFTPSNSPCVLTLPRGEGRELCRLTD